MRKILLLVCILSCNIAITQNVGIGTTKPSEKLDVNGNIKADTVKSTTIKIVQNAGEGKVLTSDANGNGSWQMNSLSSSSGNSGYGVWGDCATNGNLSEYYPLSDGPRVGAIFGTSIAISGNYAIVGTPSDDIGGNPDQGSASIYHFNGSNWVLMQKLTDPSGATHDMFGSSVSIAGNYAVIGADSDDLGSNVNQGSVSVYHFNGSSWMLMQKLADPTGEALDRFGNSVSISGNYLIIGAYLDDVGLGVNKGSASIYQRTETFGWVLMQKITDSRGSDGDEFGGSVSISGSYALVGAEFDNLSVASPVGSASVYHYDGIAWTFMQKIVGPDVEVEDFFGHSVSISGNYLVIGAYRDDVGSNVDQGSASIYELTETFGWVLMHKITHSGAAAFGRFGQSVSMSGNYIIVGANREDIGSNINQGSVHIYIRVGHGWGKLQYMTDPMGEASEEFGTSTAIDGATRRFLISAPGFPGTDAVGLKNGKVVFGKIN